MHILITGASGLLGLNLALKASKDHKVTGVDRRKLTGVPFDMIVSDLLDKEAVRLLLDQVRPDCLIHCAALADLEACEADPDLAYSLNTNLPATLAIACKEWDVKMLHISTDAVFNGEQEGLYTESDVPDPQSIYAKTKLRGEQVVLEENPHAAVARVNFYGSSLSGKRSLVEFFINNLSAGKPIKGFTDVTFTPTYVFDLGEMLFAIMKKDLCGLYHTVGCDCLSKFDFGVAVARRFMLDEHLVTPDSVDRSGLTARRAHNLCLSTDKLCSDLGMRAPAFLEGLDKFYLQYLNGYPQQIRSYDISTRD